MVKNVYEGLVESAEKAGTAKVPLFDVVYSFAAEAARGHVASYATVVHMALKGDAPADDKERQGVLAFVQRQMVELRDLYDKEDVTRCARCGQQSDYGFMCNTGYQLCKGCFEIVFPKRRAQGARKEKAANAATDDAAGRPPAEGAPAEAGTAPA